MLSDPSSLSCSPSTEQGYFITLIKELTLANTKLKMELLNGNLLSFGQSLDDHQVSSDTSPTVEHDEDQHLTTGEPHDASTTSQTNSLLTDQELEEDTMTVSRSIDVNENPLLSKVPSPTTSSSLPTSSKHGAIHYHYHYNSHKAKRPLSTIFHRSYNILNKGQQVKKKTISV